MSAPGKNPGLSIGYREARVTPPMHPIIDILRVLLERMKQAPRKGALYGPRLNPFTKKMEIHEGIDLAIPTGTPIYAPWDGVVEKAWDDLEHGGGTSLIIRHEAVKLMSGYCHLQGIEEELTRGMTVRRGQQVARSGASGKATGPHLHFTIRLKMITDDWVKIDPLHFLLRADPEGLLI